MAGNLFASHSQSGISLSGANSQRISFKPAQSISLATTGLSLTSPARDASQTSVSVSPQTPSQANETHDVVIIGSGPAGYTAAIYLGRAGYRPHIFGGELSPGGQLTTTTEVENFPGFPDGIQGPELMDRMKQQALRFGATIENVDVTTLERDSDSGSDSTPDSFIINTSTGTTHRSKAVIVSTGSHHRTLGVPGEKEYSGHGVSYCATCDGFFFKDKPIAVIGGGDSALTEALFLAKFGSHVTIVHRRDTFRASQSLVDKVMANPKIAVEWNSVTKQINGDGTAATSITLERTDSENTSELAANGIFVAIGTEPNSAFLNGVVNTDSHGYITVDGASTRTSLLGVFAAGDVVDPIYQQAISAAGMGCRAALDAQDWLESL